MKKIAILGFGVVGRGAYETVAAHPLSGIAVKKVLDIRVPTGFEDVVTTDYQQILTDPEIEIVAEAIGGLHPAYEFVTAAMKAGKSVVTANKHLVCTFYRELHTLAEESGVEFRYTPAVGGGIPWLYNLRRIIRLDEVSSLSGIMNGTTNYILDGMTHRGAEFSSALSEAQRLGYAEADPSADIDGLDVRRKCAISASVAFGAVLTEDDVPTFGIRHILKADTDRFSSMGYVCKLLATAEKIGDRVTAYVEPTLLSKDSETAAVGSNFNIITVEAKRVGRLSFIGQGAGKDPTGMALAEDCLDIAEKSAVTKTVLGDVKISHDLKKHPYYVRTGAALADEYISHRLDGAYITVPLTVEKIHHIIKEVEKKDPAPFVAGIPEE